MVNQLKEMQDFMVNSLGVPRDKLITKVSPVIVDKDFDPNDLVDFTFMTPEEMNKLKENGNE